ncbi:MAG: ceramidase [Bacteroidales bacterium]|nr:ceramidase [Bacteroidales bacterium]MCF8333887.1 ceramidase [Bacteroidales bacterium]
MTQETQKKWYDMELPDGGPIYTETSPDQLIVEPWNAISSLLYMIPALLWLWYLRKHFSQNKFILFAGMLIILGSLGSTLFHAFRASVVFLILDVLPVAILTLSISIYFWTHVFKRWEYVLLVIVPLFGLRFLIFNILPDNLAINLSYALTGVMVALPLLILFFQKKLVKTHYVLYTMIAFGLALLFREMDSWQFQLLPMGTHFLWHAFSGVGTWFILGFLYHYKNYRGKRKQHIETYVSQAS